MQAASDAIFSRAAAPRTLPRAIPFSFATSTYETLDAVVPAPYVDDMLARAALQRGDLRAASAYALRLPNSSPRSDLLGRIALQRGERLRAQAYFLQAGDAAAIDAQVDELARHDPRSAYALEERLLRRLQRSGTRPDAVAEAQWRLGVLAASEHRPQLAMHNYARAAQLSPLSGKYLIFAGFQAYDLQRWQTAQRYFARTLQVDPRSADAYAGEGMAALALGDRAAAIKDAAQSRAVDPHSHALSTLQHLLHE